MIYQEDIERMLANILNCIHDNINVPSEKDQDLYEAVREVLEEEFDYPDYKDYN